MAKPKTAKKQPAKKPRKSTSAKLVARRPRKRLTPRESQVVSELADALGKLVPATSQGPFSLQGLAKAKGLGKFFNEKLPSKKRQFVHFICEVQRAKPRTLKGFINDLLAEAIAKRREKGNPVLRPEAESLKATLLEFGIDLGPEIDELKLPATRPYITPPPITLQQSLERIGLHPLLLDRVTKLFKDGHVNEAVRKAGEVLEAAVMRWSGSPKIGRDLMATVFNAKVPIIDIAAYHESEIGSVTDEREGFMYLAMGTMQWCKNIVGHGDVAQLRAADAAGRIILVSHLLQVIDATVNKGVAGASEA